MACFLVLLSLPGEWIWTDASHRISMGLDYTPGETVFTDLDDDGDEDMVRLIQGSSIETSLRAYENVSDQTGDRMWESNDGLIQGIDSESVVALGAGDINSDGIEEIVLRRGDNLIAYVRIDGGWEPDNTLFDGFDDQPVPFHHDFADVDDDGDLDMVGGWGSDEFDLYPGFWWNTGTPAHPSWEFDSTYINPDRDPPYHPGDLEHFEHPNWVDYDDDGLWDILYTQWNWADPPPYCCDVHVLINKGTGENPSWEDRLLSSMQALEQQDDVVVFDWNDDGIEDMLLTGYEYVEGLYYLEGYRESDSLRYDFDHPFVWGGIISSYPAAADVDDDGLPELTVVRYDFQMDIWGHPGWIYPCFSYLSSTDQNEPKWRLEGCYGYWNYFVDILETKGHQQYVDFNGDDLIDYIRNIVDIDTGYNLYGGKHMLYLNRGTETQPNWVLSQGSLSDLPPLLPSCFIDIDNDRDLDVIGVLVSDGSLAAFNNRGGSRENPTYGRYDRLILGLEGLEVSYMAPADLNCDGIDDLAVGLSGGGLTAFTNYYPSLGHWVRNDEVFAGIDGGNPCLADGDGDGDLDLYLSRGRLCYYINESTEGISEPFARSSFPSVIVAGSEVEIKVPLASGSITEVSFSLFNVAGQRVRCLSESALGGEVCFRFSQRPGVYFYQIKADNETYSGKLAICP